MTIDSIDLFAIDNWRLSLNDDTNYLGLVVLCAYGNIEVSDC